MNIDALFQEYCHRLKCRKRELAMLQLTGNIEGYLVKEFVIAVSEHADGELFAATIGGTKRDKRTHEPRVDICILEGPLRASQEDLRIVSMLEVKYFTNSRLLGLGKSADVRYDKGARGRLETLRNQARTLQDDYEKGGTLDGIQVSSSAVPRRCALVLAGYQRAKPDEGPDTRSGQEDFDTRRDKDVFDKLQKALEEKFIVDEGNGLCEVYQTSTTVLRMPYTVGLRAGLFAPKP